MKIDHRFKAICFDMDGTLLNTIMDYDKLGTVVVDTLVSLGVPAERINDHATDVEMIRDASSYLRSVGKEMTFEQIEGCVNRNSGKIEMERVYESSCFPGTEELLEFIKKEGYKVGLLTRGQREYAETAMSHCGILDMMDAVEAFDDHPTGEQKPNPIAMEYLAKNLGVEPKEILYLGDSPCDYFCSRDSGASFIGICAGERGQRKWKDMFGDIEMIKVVTDIRDMF